MSLDPRTVRCVAMTLKKYTFDKISSYINYLSNRNSQNSLRSNSAHLIPVNKLFCVNTTIILGNLLPYEIPAVDI